MKTTNLLIAFFFLAAPMAAQTVHLNLEGPARRIVFTGPGADSCNSLFNREALKEVSDNVVLDGTIDLPPLSLSVYVLEEK